MTRNLADSKDDIDKALAAIPNLARQLQDTDRRQTQASLGARRASTGAVTTNLAYGVWKRTALALYPTITSSIELYGPSGDLRSRFAFNLPEEPRPPFRAPDEAQADRFGWTARLGRSRHSLLRFFRSDGRCCTPVGRSA